MGAQGGIHPHLSRLGRLDLRDAEAAPSGRGVGSHAPVPALTPAPGRSYIRLVVVIVPVLRRLKPLALASVGALAALKLALHLWVNATSLYGLHRDEFLYLAMGRHLRLWAMDFP